jgi:hypothetical protein
MKLLVFVLWKSVHVSRRCSRGLIKRPIEMIKCRRGIGRRGVGGYPGWGNQALVPCLGGDRAIKGGGGERRGGVLEEKVGLRRGGFRV